MSTQYTATSQYIDKDDGGRAVKYFEVPERPRGFLFEMPRETKNKEYFKIDKWRNTMRPPRGQVIFNGYGNPPRCYNCTGNFSAVNVDTSLYVVSNSLEGKQRQKEDQDDA